MGKLKWYKRDPVAALEGMMGLTIEQKACYGTVLDLIYAKDNQLRDDDKLLAAWCDVDIRVWRRVKKELTACGKLFVEDGLIRNARADRGVDEGLCRVQGALRAASISVEARKRKSEAETNENNDLFEAPAQASAQASVERAFEQPTTTTRKEEEEEHSRSSRIPPQESSTPRTEPRSQKDRNSENGGGKTGKSPNGANRRKRYTPGTTTIDSRQERTARFEKSLAENIAGGWTTVIKAKNRRDDDHEWAMGCVHKALAFMHKQLPNDWPPADWSP